jgi:hypothetical protein
MSAERHSFAAVCAYAGISEADIVREVQSHFTVDAAFATGSFVEGRNGPTSDLDIRAICCPSSVHPDVDRNFNRRDLYWCGSTRMSNVGDVMVHTIYWPADIISELTRKVADAVFDGKTPIPVFTAEQIELFEEARVYAPVINPSRCASIVTGFDLDKFSHLQEHILEMRYDQACGETDGPLAKGDFLMAAVRSRTAVEAAADCWLNFNGRKTAKGKWRLRELAACAGEDSVLFRTFVNFIIGDLTGLDDGALRAAVEQRLAWCNTILLDLQS